MKAIGVGVDKISPLEIEILHNEEKKPFAVLSGKAKKHFENLPEKNIEISISHTKKIATAIAILW